MALTLTAALGVPTQLDPAIRLTITGTVPAAIAAGYQFRLEGEVLELRYFGETEQSILGGAATQTVPDRNVWYAQRGVAGTTIATHALGTAVVGLADALAVGTDQDPPSPFASGGGGPHSTTHEDAGADEVRTRVTDTVEDVEATEIEFVFAPSVGTLAAVLAAGNDTGGLGITATAYGSGTATADITATSVDGDATVNRTAHATSDGGAEGKTTVRADGASDATALIAVTSLDGNALANRTADAMGDGSVQAETTIRARNAGDASAHVIARVDGDGDANAQVEAIGGGSGQVIAGSKAAAAQGIAIADLIATSGNMGAQANQTASSQGTGDADAMTTATTTAGDAYATTTATSGTGQATAVATATSGANTASIGPVATPTTALIMVTGLPTADPVLAGALWNDSGTLKVSAG